MTIKPLVLYPKNELELRTSSMPVSNVNQRTKKLIKDLKDTLNAHNGLGIAAPQIGVHLQVLVVCFGETEERTGEISKPFVIINPIIISQGLLVKGYDGCLSLPGLMGYSHRPKSLEIKALDENGNPIHMILHDFDARMLHHEIDHLLGILYIDRIHNKKNDLYVIKDGDNHKTYAIPFKSLFDKNIGFFNHSSIPKPTID